MKHREFRYVIQSRDGKGNPRVLTVNQALAEVKNGARWDVHRSVARYDEGLATYQRQQKKTAGYVGPCYADYLRFDIDRDGLLTDALGDARRLATTLHEHYGLREDQTRYFVSGQKGFEVAFPMQLCGDVEPSVHTPAVLKRMAMAIAEYAGDIELDLNVYRRLGMIRVAGTQHPARPPAGQDYRFKMELCWSEFSTWTVDQMLELAMADPPRELEYRPHDFEPLETLAELHARCLIDAEEYARRPRPEPIRLRGEPIDVTSIEGIVRPFYVEGRRHDLSLHLAGYLAKNGVDQEQAEAVVAAIAKEDDDDGEASIGRVRYTYATLAEGDEVRGYTGLVEILPEDALHELATLVEPSKNGKDDGIEPEPPLLQRLPSEFWDSRPVLKHIRQAAHSRNRSPDATLHAALARVAAFLPPAASIDTGIGSPASPNYYVLIVDPSGAGKSSPHNIARDLIDAPPNYDLPDPLPPGSGESLAEAFMGNVEVERTDSKGRTKTVTMRKQTRYHALLYVDEGQELMRQLERNGSTVGPALRRGWVGETLGQFNATIERQRVIRDYSLGLVVGFQPAALLPLFGEAGLGTPQRFCFTGCIDPTMPDTPPPWPGKIDLRIYGTWINFTIDDEIKRQLRRDDTAVVRGKLKRDPLDRHEPLHLIKLAALLAVLDNRRDINLDDWRLAKVNWETSCACRNQLVDYGHALHRARQRRETRAHVGRTLAADRALKREETTVERVARIIARRVRRAAEPLKRGELSRAVNGRDKRFVARAITYAVRAQWIIEREDGLYESGPVQP